MVSKVAIVGDGQMALVLADLLVDQGMEVSLWGPFPEDLEDLRATRESPRLPGFRLPEPVKVERDPQRLVEGAAIVVNAIPTQHVRTVWSGISYAFKQAAAGCTIVSVAKGIENDSLLRPSEVIASALGGADPGRFVVLSGPTIAAELARRLPATMVASGEDCGRVEAVQQAFSSPWLRVYSHDDPVGVEIAGALKNVIALAAGMVDGLGAGNNAKSALLARGLAEIARLGVAMGAKAETFFGVAGVGDLATTCFSPEGRNRSCGERLGRGERLEEILGSSTSVVEGVPTTRSVVMLAQRLGIEMPITEAVNAILYEGLSPRQAIIELMGRRLKAERVG